MRKVRDSISVDSSCRGDQSKGIVEYRGVHTTTGEEIFKVGPLLDGTNNAGEFLAIVHALALMKSKGDKRPIYSDSEVAMLWVDRRWCRTTLRKTENNAKILELIARANTWLRDNDYDNRILKWHTKMWGEIPADFGRKG